MPIRPFERLGHRRIALSDKGQHLGLQPLYGGKAGAFEYLAHQNTAPHLNLVHPGGMLRGIVEHKAMRGIGEKGGTCGHRLQNAVLVLLSVTKCHRVASGSEAIVRTMWVTKSASGRVGLRDEATTRPCATSKLTMSVKVPWRIYANARRSTRPGPIGMGQNLWKSKRK
jgi:hypothetical protein